ncbi:hypothetical protein [Pseudomonas fluorescens]|uniref:Uncharacterized protein n=1 Tax=Pseudomonas fluorescens TaxID=294 RepID=A0A5E7DQR4_PSEFL|nr:hypothetical protein [Pseudomonas fluorescens]VVO18866.1 hypothetical protein PS691_04026 [Pseudomonas fluorescens]
MNSALLLLLNALALAVVVVFHFQTDDSTVQLASTTPHYIQHQAPKPAVVSDDAVESAWIARDTQVGQPSQQSSPSWVF